jgi:endonuclease/exonuclease/phosphatase family metal-dependent hydrolase
MIAHALWAAVLALPTTGTAAPPPISVMTWNICASHNTECFFYGANHQDVAWKVAWYARSLAIKPDVIMLQEFCSGGTGTLERTLEEKTGRTWTVRSATIKSADGTAKTCASQTGSGASRGNYSIALAVADSAPTISEHALTSPSWYQRRVALCATIPAKKARVCGAHLSSGLSYDDHQAGAPYRTKQVQELMAVAANSSGNRPIIGGDLNARPPGGAGGTAAERAVTTRLYDAYQECDQQGDVRNGRATHDNGLKLDYLFAPKGTVTGCFVEQQAASSDHKPVYIKVS